MKRSKRCAWCGRSDGTVKPVTVEVVGSLGIKKQIVEVGVHAEHQPELLSYIDHLNKHAFHFIVLNLVLATISIILLFTYWAYDYRIGRISGIITISYGIVLFLFPFGTATTESIMSIRTSRRFIRDSGILIMAIGVFLFIITVL